MVPLPNMWLHSVHYTVFHQTNCLSSPDVIIETLHLIRDTFSHINFDSITVKYLDRYVPSTLKPLNRNWINIEKKIKEGRIATLVYGLLNSDGYGFQLGVSFSLFSERNRKTYSIGQYDHIEFWVDRWVLQQNIISFEECSTLINMLWKTINGVYGYADYFIENVRGSASEQRELAATQEFGAKLITFAHISPSKDLRQEIPDIYWLNLLNHNHIRLLMESGITMQDLANFTTGELANGGLELQLSPTPFIAKEPGFAVAQERLKSLLAPLSPK